jgi:hypothetical protein
MSGASLDENLGDLWLAPGKGARYLFYVSWVATTIWLAWLLLRKQGRFDSPEAIPSLLALMVCTVALIRWLPSPPPAGSLLPTRRLHFLAAGLLLLAALFGWYALFGRQLITGFPLAALALLAVIRVPLSRATWLYTVALASVAGLASLAATWLDAWPYESAILQVMLVVTCLPAGWAILQQEGLLQRGLGTSIWLTRGARAAAVAFSTGMLLSAPWAMFNVVFTDVTADTWARAWWAPLVALQPAIVEESWARVLFVSIVYAALRPYGSERAALTVSIFLTGYWFAYLHAQGSPGELVSTLLLGTLYSLPMTYLWLRRGYETAVGFHFAIDALRFGVAYLANAAT